MDTLEPKKRINHPNSIEEILFFFVYYIVVLVAKIGLYVTVFYRICRKSTLEFVAKIQKVLPKISKAIRQTYAYAESIFTQKQNKLRSNLQTNKNNFSELARIQSKSITRGAAKILSHVIRLQKDVIHSLYCTHVASRVVITGFLSKLQAFSRQKFVFVPSLAKPRTKKTRKTGFLPIRKLHIVFFALGFFVSVILVTGFESYYFVKALPNPDAIGKVNFDQSTHIYDRHGRLLYEVYRDQNRTPVKLKDLPQHVADATIAIEDKDFYHHKGVSLFSGIFRSLREMIVYKMPLQGGSTITQQLVKSALLTPERTISRKVKEMILALWAERLYTKNQILEMYLNQVPYGGLSYGIEEAAQTYFDKNAKDLTLSEAALLAGLPQAPSVYSPFANPAGAISRRNDVLRNMFKEELITEAQLQEALAQNLTFAQPKTTIHAPHFVFYVRQKLDEMYGSDRVEKGGLQVTTTLDLDIQERAEQVLKEELDKVQNLQVGNGAVLVTDPQTGEILAMVGSKDYYEKPYGAWNVVEALRQPGSSIKPLVYAMALEKGFTAATTLEDTPVNYYSPGAPSYSPVNYDGRFHGRVTLRSALANSYNIPAVRVLNTLGVKDFISYAQNLGIDTWKDTDRFGLSLALGGGEVTMLDMAEAFGVFADSGKRTTLNPILKLTDNSGKIHEEFYPESTAVLRPEVAYVLSDILSDNNARIPAFGPRSLLEIPNHKVAVKTGTTNDKKDNWTIGYTPNFLVAVWVGNNDSTPMNPYLTSGITGAAPIWNRVASYLFEKYPQTAWYQKPNAIVEKPCFGVAKEVFIAGTEGSVRCGPMQNLSEKKKEQVSQ